jgi:hypothetical protein
MLCRLLGRAESCKGSRLRKICFGRFVPAGKGLQIWYDPLGSIELAADERIKTGLMQLNTTGKNVFPSA